MSRYSERREQDRADRIAQAEAARLAAATKTDLAVATLSARGDERRKDEALAQKHRDEASKQRAATWKARWTAVRTWSTAHVVDLLIYPLAVASAVMAVPAMAAFGHDTYGTATGYLLPLLSEFGMWSFAIAVSRSRKTSPDKPVGWLQAGIWLSAAAAVVLNAVHGFSGPEHDLGKAGVMAIVSVFGVAAHQLLTASPRRSRTERDTRRAARESARIVRAAEEKVAAARRAAVARAVTEIDPDGTARLVFTPGRFELRRGRLAPAVIPGLPVTPLDPVGESIADQAAAWLRTGADPTDTTGSTDKPDPTDVPDGPGPVGTLDRPSDLHQSSADRPTIPNPKRRSMEQLRAELADKVAAGTVDPTVIDSIRTGLKVGADRARRLHQEFGQKKK